MISWQSLIFSINSFLRKFFNIFYLQFYIYILYILNIQKKNIKWEKRLYHTYNKSILILKIWLLYKGKYKTFFYCAYIWKVFSQQTKFLLFSDFSSSLLKYKRSFLSSGLESFIFRNIRSGFSERGFFIFWAPKVTSWNIRCFLGS